MFDSSGCVLRLLAVVIILGVSGASLCEDDQGSRPYTSSTEGTRKRCCKVAHYIDRKETKRFYCEGGCCGDTDDEYCCAYINKEALPYVIGFSIFGVLVVVIVGIILFCVFRKVCKGFKEYKQHKTQFKEAYSARTLDELLAAGEESATAPPGTILHPVVSAECT